MPDNNFFRLSTGTLPTGEFYQVVQHPAQANLGLVVTSGGDSFDTSLPSLTEQGLVPHPIHVRERKDGFETLLPPTIGKWPVESLKPFLAGDPPPTTLRALFEETRGFLATFAWIPHVVALNLVTILTFLSYWVKLFPAICIAEICGPIASGKSTLMRLLAKVCRSPIFCSSSTPAALARAREREACTLLFDEPIPPSKDVDSLILASNQQDTHRLICGPGQELLLQDLFGLSVKVFDRVSEAIKSRVVTIDTVQCPHPLPPYISARHSSEVERLIGCFFWLSLLHYERVFEAYTHFMETTSVIGRGAEKIGPLLAIARCIDASDPEQDPIGPGVEEYLLEQLARQRQERLTTDPELLVLAGTKAFLCRNGRINDSGLEEVSASILTEFLKDDSGEALSIQRVGGFLRKHGVIKGYRRARQVKGPIANRTQHPQTIYELDLARLEATLATHGINQTEEEEVPAW